MANYQGNVSQGFDHPIFEEISNMNRKMFYTKLVEKKNYSKISYKMCRKKSLMEVLNKVTSFVLVLIPNHINLLESFFRTIT